MEYSRLCFRIFLLHPELLESLSDEQSYLIFKRLNKLSSHLFTLDKEIYSVNKFDVPKFNEITVLCTGC